MVISESIGSKQAGDPESARLQTEGEAAPFDGVAGEEGRGVNVPAVLRWRFAGSSGSMRKSKGRRLDILRARVRSVGSEIKNEVGETAVEEDNRVRKELDSLHEMEGWCCQRCTRMNLYAGQCTSIPLGACPDPGVCACPLRP